MNRCEDYDKVGISALSNQDFYGKEFMDACRQIRQCARVGNLIVNTDVDNILFDFIELCGLSVQEFVTGYLSVLQPYCLGYFQRENDILKIETGYFTQMIIKLDEDKPMSISFCGSQCSYRLSVKDFSDKPCAVLVDGVNNIAGTYSISAYIQTGFIRYNLIDTAIALYKDVALINYSSIERNVNNISDILFNRLASAYASSGVPTFGNLNNIASFSGRGYAVINQLILIIDLYSAYTDANSVKVLVEMMRNIISELEISEKRSILNALVSKFGRAPKNRLANLMYKELS